MVPSHLWDIRICEPLGLSYRSLPVQHSLQILHRLLEDCLKLNVLPSFTIYILCEHHDLWSHWCSFLLHCFHYPFLFVPLIWDLRKLVWVHVWVVIKLFCPQERQVGAHAPTSA